MYITTYMSGFIAIIWNQCQTLRWTGWKKYIFKMYFEGTKTNTLILFELKVQPNFIFYVETNSESETLPFKFNVFFHIIVCSGCKTETNITPFHILKWYFFCYLDWTHLVLTISYIYSIWRCIRFCAILTWMFFLSGRNLLCLI